MSTTLMRRAFAGLIAGGALACAALLAAQAPPASAPQGLDTAGMDRAVKPGDNFFAFANGSWVKSTPIPADRSGFGAAGMVYDLTNARTVQLIQQAANSQKTTGDARKVGDYYASFMDEAGIEKKGIQPLQPALDRIAAIADRQSLARVIGSMLRADVDALNNTNFYTDNLLGLWVAADLDDPTRYLPFLLQGGLGMPDRDYYLDTSPQMTGVRTKYQAHIAAMLTLAGVAGAPMKAARVFDLEKRIAAVHATRLDSGDVKKGNNHWTRQDFDRRAPGLEWQAFFASAGLERQPAFVVWHPGGISGIAALTASQPLDTWKAYLTARTIEHFAPYLPKAFVQERFSFYGRTLSGTPMLRERWKRGVDDTNAALGESVGKLYAERYFSPDHKAKAEAMVRNLIAAFGTRVERLAWMAPQTKAKAKAKLATLKVGVGYPDHWIDYAGLSVVRGDALGNSARAELFEYRRQLAKLGRPVDRSEWVMTPQTVNAVNLPVMNAMNFPAAILQPPFFDPARPAAMDYGAIGATIGHEISHSFDDQGALFDASGKLQNWWTPQDLTHFQTSAAKLVAQYDRYKPFPDLALKGKQVLAENIADVAGLATAYDAYRLSMNGRTAPVVEGFSGDQQFFISYGQSWREKSREPALRQQIITDGHAPGEYRADTVRNLDAWYAAFGVKPGQTLYLAPADRVRVW